MATELKELYWAAGFMEGEGSFSAVVGTRKGSPRRTCNVMVHAGQVNREPLERLQRMFGGGIYRHNMHTGNPCWRWQVAGNRAAGLMMTFWSLVSQKRREQIEKAIALWKLNRPHKEAVLRGDAWREARNVR